MKLKKYVAEGLRGKTCMSVDGRDKEESDRVEAYLTRNSLLAVSVPGGSWKAGSGAAMSLPC